MCEAPLRGECKSLGAPETVDGPIFSVIDIWRRIRSTKERRWNRSRRMTSHDNSATTCTSSRLRSLTIATFGYSRRKTGRGTRCCMPPRGMACPVQSMCRRNNPRETRILKRTIEVSKGPAVAHSTPRGSHRWFSSKVHAAQIKATYRRTTVAIGWQLDRTMSSSWQLFALSGTEAHELKLWTP
jgi:hypothetical protein